MFNTGKQSLHTSQAYWSIVTNESIKTHSFLMFNPSKFVKSDTNVEAMSNVSDKWIPVRPECLV